MLLSVLHLTKNLQTIYWDQYNWPTICSIVFVWANFKLLRIHCIFMLWANYVYKPIRNLFFITCLIWLFIFYSQILRNVISIMNQHLGKIYIYVKTSCALWGPQWSSGLSSRTTVSLVCQHSGCEFESCTSFLHQKNPNSISIATTVVWKVALNTYL